MRHALSSLNHKNRGSALLMLLVFLSVMATVLMSALGTANRQIERDRITAAALAQAKEALIGYAASVALTPLGAKRPGDLPCPDANNDGVAETWCGNTTGSMPNLRLGRLPWKTLELPDLRDGYGERLWYAVSNNFKNNTRTATLNSDTNGTITVRDAGGNMIFDATGATGVIAAVFAPGAPLTRQGDAAPQDRSCAPCDAQDVCTATPVTNTPRCNPVNYLDIALGEDNANFQDGNANGFLQGPINAAGVAIVNDQLVVITPNDLMPALEKRVAGEALTCLVSYAANPQNRGRYPWAAPLDPLALPAYIDASGRRFGRIPDSGAGMVNTVASSGLINPMDDSWTGVCKIRSISGWWLNWKESVFYAVADAYKPVNQDIPSVPGCGVTGTCLAVNPPSTVANKQVTVIAAGRRLATVAGGQPRTTAADRGTITNYLENQNATPLDDAFERNVITSAFNDAASYRE